MRRAAVALGCVLVTFLAAPRRAAAHQSSVTYLEATLTSGAVEVSVQVAARDLVEALGGSHQRDSLPSPLSAAVSERVLAYVVAGVQIADGDTECPAREPTVAPRAERLEVRFTAVCPAPPTSLVLDYDLFFEVDPNHTAALRVTVAGAAPADALLDAEHARFVWDLTTEVPSGWRAFVRSGVHHVATGLDHVAFVLALLLGLVIERGAHGRRVRRLTSAVRATAVVVSGFTLGHSITLVAAAAGWVELPARWVESAIAASIVWTAGAHLLGRESRHRFAVAFGFGLVHGLGFARMLAVLLPPGDILVPLLSFNVGVEIAQLAIVGLAVPAAWVIARRLGAERYRALALPLLAAPLLVLGAIWLVERVCDTTWLGW